MLNEEAKIGFHLNVSSYPINGDLPAIIHRPAIGVAALIGPWHADNPGVDSLSRVGEMDTLKTCQRS